MRLGTCTACVHGRETWRGVTLCARRRRKFAFIERSTLLWLATGLRSCGPLAIHCAPDPAKLVAAARPARGEPIRIGEHVARFYPPE